MTKEEYVLYESARLLKECGFPQEIDCGDGIKIISTPYCYTPDGVKHLYAGARKMPEWIAAPTQSLAMRWLREKEIHVHVWYNCICGWECDLESLAAEYIDTDCKIESYVCVTQGSYEQAAEAGIKAACEYLIKQSKEK